jgi:hypothetical protein
MPGIFTVIDNLMTSFYDNKPTSILSPDLEPGIITLGGLIVQSKPIVCEEYNCEIIIYGKVDSLMQFDNGTIGVIDFKTSYPYKGSTDLYFPQLMCYTIALEFNDPEKTKPCKVSKLGLCCFTPESFAPVNDGYGLIGATKWLEIQKDKAKIKTFLHEIAKLLTGEPPEQSPDCKFCNFKKA